MSFLRPKDCLDISRFDNQMILRIILLILLVQTTLVLHGQNACFSDCSKVMNSNIPFTKKLSILEGCTIPSFTATTLKGKKIDSEKLKGKVVVVNFWYIGCSPCRAEMPGMNKLVAKYRGKVEFLSFSKDDPKRLRDFLKKNSVDFEVIPNSFDLDQKFCVVAGYPTNMVIDRAGKVALIFSGGRIDDKAPAELISKLEPTIVALIKN